MDQITSSYCDRINFEAIKALHGERLEDLHKQARWQELLSLLDEFSSLQFATALERDFASQAVRCGRQQDLSEQRHAQLVRAVDLLIPWRKGPFSLFGLEIDSEWRSDFKWERLSAVLPKDLKCKKLADVGCGNAYYMFRALSLNPECIVGFDPSQNCYLAYRLLQAFLREKSLEFLLLGAEHLALFPKFFDIVICMGVLYHHRDPLRLLQIMREGMAKDSEILVESICIPGEEAYSLTPEKTYAGMKNVYFVPTLKALENWLKKTGFYQIEVCSVVQMSELEQRTTRYAPFRSYAESLAPDCASKTQEGYPAPLRVMLKARRRE